MSTIGDNRFAVVLACTVVCTGMGMAESPSDTADVTVTEVGEDSYFEIRISGTIGLDFTAERMSAMLGHARQLGVTRVVIIVDTRGGLVPSAERIVDLIIDNDDLHFIAYVERALSAGAPIVMACSEVYVHPRATIGAAVSYRSGGEGRPIQLPADVAEKNQSYWRAVCRKAAQHGGHDSLLAEAMVDPDFQLSLSEDNDRIILHRDGPGRVLKAKGRVLTLTASEAVECGLAVKVAGDAAFLGEAVTYRESLLRQADGTSCTTIEGPQGSSVLYRKISAKVEELGLNREELTMLQATAGMEELNNWVGGIQGRLSRQQLRWSVTLLHAGERYRLRRVGDSYVRTDQLLVDYLETRTQQARTRLYRSQQRYREARSQAARARARERARSDRNAYRALSQGYNHVRRYPYELWASCPQYPEMIMLAYVSEGSRDRLLEADRSELVHLLGKLDGIYVMRDGEYPWVLTFLDEVQLATDPAAPQAVDTHGEPDRFEEAEEAQANSRLSLARLYQQNDMHTRAREILQELIENHPGTTAAEKARAMLQE